MPIDIARQTGLLGDGESRYASGGSDSRIDLADAFARSVREGLPYRPGGYATSGVPHETSGIASGGQDGGDGFGSPPPSATPTADPTHSQEIGSSIQDQHVHDWLDSLGGAISATDKQSLEQLGDDVATLQNWYSGFQAGDPAANNMPANVADAKNRLLSSDAVAKQIKGSDGSLSYDSVNSFLMKLEGAADTAKASWASFMSDNPHADPVATQEAVNASVLQGDFPVLDAAGSNSPTDGLIDGADLAAVMNGNNSSLPDALKSAAGFYSSAGEFGELDTAGDSAGTKADNTVANNNLDALLSHMTSKSEDDTIAGLKNAALQQVVAETGGDPSKVNSDYFANPGSSTATGADKLAALVQLSKGVGDYYKGESEYQHDSPSNLDTPDQFHQNYGDGPTPGQQRDAFIKQVQDRIDTLSQDKDVQALLADKMPAALQGLVGSNPDLRAALEKGRDAASSSQALEAAFDQKDAKGNPVSTTDALSAFEAKVDFYNEALAGPQQQGSTSHELAPPNRFTNIAVHGGLAQGPNDRRIGAGQASTSEADSSDLSKALDGAPQAIKDRVKQSYDDITSGKEIDDLVKSGMPQAQAMIKSALDKTVYDRVLGKDDVQSGSDRFNDYMAKLGRDQLTDGKSADDMLKGLGINGVDDPKLQQVVNDNLDTLVGPDGQKGQANSGSVAGDVVNAIRSINDAMRGGLKFDDAMAKVQKDWKSLSPSTIATAAYKAGVFHAASAMLLAGVLAGRISVGQSSLSTTSQIFGTAGLLTEGGAKLYATTLNNLKDTIANNKKLLAAIQTDPNADGLASLRANNIRNSINADQSRLTDMTNIGKWVENSGKAVGGVIGNALGFAAGIAGAVQSAHDGKIGDAAAQGVFAGLNGISTVASGTEIAAWLIPRLSSNISAATPALFGLTFEGLGGAAGALGGVVGGVASVGGLLYSIIKGVQDSDRLQQDQNAWYSGLQDAFGPSGVTLPDEGTLISPPNGAVPDGNPVAPY